MKEGNNIDKFFKKRLGNSSVEEADWNVPSDDIWNAANLHFPKEKKKRPFIFWFFGFGFVVLAIFLWNSFNSSNNSLSETISESKNNQHRELSLPASGKQVGDSRSSTSTLENTLDVSAPKSLTADNVIINTTTKSVMKLSNEPAQITTKSPNKNTTTAMSENSNPLLDLWSSEERKKINANQHTDRPEEASIQPVTTTISTRLNLNSAFNNKTGTSLAHIDDSNNESIENKIEQGPVHLGNPDQINNNQENKSKSIDIAKEQLSTLPGLTIAQFNNDVSNQEFPSLSLLEVIKKRPIYKWEVGISHAPFIFNPFSVANGDIEINNDFNLTSTYRNINFHLTRRLGSRFSLSSGAYYSTLDVNLDFDFRDAYNADTFKSKVTDHVGIGSLQINEENSDFEIVFIPGTNVNIGDTLQVVSEIPIQLSLIQIPFLLNYHIRRGKFDWMLHTGVSLDYLTAKINNIDFQIFKEGKQVSKPVDFNSIQDSQWGLSIYAGGGIKYHIGQHLNVGISAKFDLSGIIFSRYDIGLFYEF